MADFIYDVISSIIIAVVSGSIGVYLGNYWRKNNLRLSTDLSAESYKIKIIKDAKKHKNELYADNSAYWYDRSIETNHLYTYIAFLIKLEEITKLENLLGLKDRYIGYFRVFRNYRSHFNKLKALCKGITAKYDNSETLNIIRFRVIQEGNRDKIKLKVGVREKLTLDTNFTDMVKLDKILNEANETLRYYAEIGKLKI